MKPVAILLTFLLVAGSLAAQTTEDSVRSAIRHLFDGMKNADTKLFRSAFSDSAVLQTITRNKEGKTIVVNEDLDAFVGFIATLKKDSADERVRFETIKIDGPLAIVWAPYTFYHNGQFSHCGVDAFQLVRMEGGWKIVYLIDTRRRQGCP